MRLTSVHAQNFKSFKNLDIQLDNLNVVVGVNASGKSNFINVFAFLRDLVESGLENAISIQGGPQYLRNVNCNADANVTIELSAESEPDDRIVTIAPDHIERRMIRCVYRFSLAFDEGRSTITEDELTAEWHAVDDASNSNTFTVRRTQNQDYGLVGPQDPVGTFFLGFLRVPKGGETEHPTLLIEHEIPRSMLPLNGLRTIAMYDIESKEPKTAVLFGGKSDLEPDAHNLAIVLRRILSDPETRRKFLNLVADVLPFAEKLETESFSDNSLFFKMQERYSSFPIPATFLSDGTVDIISLIAILYFDRRRFAVIEEPERNLHPSLISKLVELLNDASRTKQIVVTTHSPEIVRYIEPRHLILISRDSSGYSRASRPADQVQVQHFLRDEITMEELYVQNLLEV